MIEIDREIVSDPNAKIVLIVEDEVIVRLWLGMTLRDVGFVVVEAGNADEAIEIVRSGIHPVALITDVRMPGSMDGLELAQKLKGEFSDLVVVVTSAHLSETPEAAAVQHFFPKPYNAVEVATRVVSLLQGQTGMGGAQLKQLCA